MLLLSCIYTHTTYAHIPILFKSSSVHNFFSSSLSLVGEARMGIRFRNFPFSIINPGRSPWQFLPSIHTGKLFIPIDAAVLGNEKTPPPSHQTCHSSLFTRKKKKQTTRRVFEYMEGRRLCARNRGRAVWLGRL